MYEPPRVKFVCNSRYGFEVELYKCCSISGFHCSDVHLEANTILMSIFMP